MFKAQAIYIATYGTKSIPIEEMLETHTYK